MRIVHVIGTIDPAGGGPPQVATRLAAAQASLGHEVHLVTYGHADGGGAERTRQQLARIPHIGHVKIHTLRAPSRFEALFASEGRKLLHHLLPGSDWLHLHGVWERVLHSATAIARGRGVPYCYRPAGMLDPWSLRQRRWKKKLALALGVRRSLDGAAFIHCLNSDEAALIEPLGLLARSAVFPNGIFLEEIEAVKPFEPFAATRPSLRGRRFVLFLARLHYKKGLDVLADAWARCASSTPEVDLVVAGPNEGAQEDFEARIARVGLTHRVHMVGPLYGADKFAALADANCFCLPSRQEGFSVAVLEALAYGVPAVISEACHFPEAAAAGAAEVVPLDASALANALRGILTNPERAKAMGLAGSNLVRQEYTWPAIAERIVHEYEGII